MWNSMVFFMILWISESFSLYHLVKNSFNFKLGFSTYFEYFRGCQMILMQKDQKNLPQTSHKIFSQAVFGNSSLLWAFMVQDFCKNSFSEGKSRENDIPVIKITFSLQKIPWNYQFPWINTKTIKYTCWFNTSKLWCFIFEIFHFIISHINLLK